MSHAVSACRFLFALVLTLAVTACSSPSQTRATEMASVAVTLEDFAVKPAADSVASGTVTFLITNAGPSYPHELKVVKTDLDPAALPTTSTGMLDQGGAGVELVGEIDGMSEGDSAELTVALTAGKYILLCNIYDDAGAHFQQGMQTSFTVTS